MTVGTMLAYTASELATICVAGLLIWKGHWIAGCIMAVLLSPTLHSAVKGGAR